MISFKQALPRLESTQHPDPSLVEEVFDAVLAGEWSPTQIAAFAVALRIKGETPEVIAAAAKTLRRHMLPLEHSLPAVLDTCGTGGDGRGSLNLSTGAAIIAASAGIPVAKHGNRAVSSKSGSADVLQELGVRIDLPPAQEASVLKETGISFLFAPTHHPAMRHVAPARKELGVRTLFNCLGPLANPASATHHLLGAYDDALRPVLAGTLNELGVKRAWVVRSEDGMDELSPFGPTRATVLDDGTLSERIITPQDFGLPLSPEGATDGGDAKENASIMRAVLGGEAHVSANSFILNAAGSIAVFEGISPLDATAKVQELLKSGAALAKLDQWVAATQKAAP